MRAAHRLYSLARVAAIGLLIVVLCVAAILAGLHTPWVQARVVRWATSRLETQGIIVQSKTLSYSLATLTVHAEGLVVSTTSDRPNPFFEAARVDVAVPRSILKGQISLSSLSADGVRVTLLRRRDGSTNFPESSKTGTTSSRSPFSVGAVDLSNVSVAWRDEGRELSAEVPVLSLHLAPAPAGSSGSVRLERPASVRAGGRDTALGADAQIAWSGSTLSFESMHLESPEGMLEGKGSVGLLVDKMPMSVEATGQLNLDRLTAWFMESDRPTGQVALSVRATGTVDDPRADLTLTTRNLSWQALRNIPAEVSAHVDATAVDLSSVRLQLLGGSADGSGRIALASAAPGAERARAIVNWHNVDIPTLLRTFDVKSPVMLSAGLDGRATASWTSWTTDGLSAELMATTRSASTDPRVLGLNGTVMLQARGGRWQGIVDQTGNGALHVEADAGGQLMAASLPASTIAGTVVATVDSWESLWRTMHDVGLVERPVLLGVGGGGRAELVLSGRLDNPGLDGKVDAVLPSLEQLRPLMPQELQASGRLSLSAMVTGTAKAPVVTGRLAGEAIEIAGQRANSFDAPFDLDANAVRVDSLSLMQEDGTLTGSGRYDFRSGEIEAQLSASRLTVNPITGSSPEDILAPVHAGLSGEWQVSGTAAKPQVTGRAELTDTKILEREIGRVTAQLGLIDQQLNTTIDLPDLFTTGTARVDLGTSGTVALDAQTTDADLAAIVSRLHVETERPLTGKASFTTHAEGSRQDLAHARVTVDLQQLSGAIGDVTVQSAMPGRATYDGRSLELADLVLNVGRTELRAAGRLGADTGTGGALTASLDGDARDLEAIAAAFLPADSAISRVRLAGRTHLEVRAQGALDRPVLEATASVTEGQVRVDEKTPAASFALESSLRDGVVTLSRLQGAWQDASLSATGEIPLALVAPAAPTWLVGPQRPAANRGRLQARLDSITPAVAAPFVPEGSLSQLTGLVSGTLTLDAEGPTLSSARGQLVLDRADLTVAGVPFAQQQPTRIDVANGRAQIVEWEWGGGPGGNRIALKGGVQFDGERTVDVALDTAIDLRMLGAFLPGIATGGRGVVTARASGRLDNPKIDGRIDLESAEFRKASPRLIVTDVDGSILLAGDELRVPDVSGQVNGGTVTVVGALKREGVRLVSGRLAVSGQGLAMAIPEALKTQANLELTLAVDRGSFSLSGDAVVLGGSYREPLSLTSGLLQSLTSQPSLVLPEERSAADDIALDIRLTTGEDIAVDNNYAQLAMAADVRIGGTVGRPTLLGHTELRDGGRIFLGGNVYQLNGAGAIDFANQSKIEPDLNITAETRVSGYNLKLNLSGTPGMLDTTLTSDPPLTQSEIVAVLLTGSKDNAGALSVSGEQVLGLLSGEVLGVTGRALGLDALRIEHSQDVRFDAGLVASETDPSSRLTFGKQVTRNIEVVFSQSLKDSGQLTWIIGYRPKSNIEMRFVSQDRESRIYDFRHDVTIGGPDTESAAAPRRTLHVASVKFTGDSGLPQEKLRDSLHLTEGKTFDFYRWQQDRDRLEKAVQEDHLEARVSTRRSGSQGDAATTVDLTYDVHEGPRTFIDISGVPDPEPLRRELERIWSEAVFDGFLVDEATSAARSRMILDGYLQAMAATSIDRSPDGTEKHLVVRVEAGPASTRRELRFSGQQHVGESRLEELARAGTSPWIDPAPFVRAVTTMYRNEGYLDATVMVGQPQLDGNVAVLPVTINEGPLFKLETITFVGARGRTVEADRKAFGLQPGAAMTRAAADSAVQALTTAYRTDGYNAVRVTLMSQTQRESAGVTLTVTIDEGRRQVVRDIETRGVRRTQPDLVSHELKLQVGQPVDQSAWAQARKRLYDTSVFRQVDIQAVPIEETKPDGEPDGRPDAQPGQPGGQAPADVTVNEQPVQARVTVEEWPPLRVRYGFELDDQQLPASEQRDLRPGVAADATYRNLFGRAATVGVALRYTKDFEAARTFFSKPSFFGLPLTSNIFFERSREHLGTGTPAPFVTDKSTVTAEQRFRAGRRLQIAYSYNFERNHSFDPDAPPDDPLNITVNIARLTGTALVDTRNDLVDATRGMMMSSTFEYGVSALGSDLRFAKYFYQQNYYRSLGHNLVFATSGRLGLAAGFDQDLIPSEKFFAGGGNSVRGYRQDSLGPVNVFGDPIGGNGLLIFNEELRFPIGWRFRGVAFFDAGNAFATIGDIRLRDLRAGVGGGLRVQTPFALLRGDIGTPVSARPGEQRIQWFFSIGQSF